MGDWLNGSMRAMAETTQKTKPAARRQTKPRTAKAGQSAKAATAKKPATKKAAAKKPAAAKSASGGTSTPRPRKKREVFHEGHKRKLLVVVDETPECESALAYAASRAQRTDGKLALVYVIEPGDFQHWLGVEEIAREEGHNKARAVFRLFGRKLKTMGFEEIVPEEIIREGHKAEEITQLIEEDHDIGVLVLGASRDPSGPGPLVTSLAGGRSGTFQIPITVVPGCLATEEILAMA
ncbi:universal stress protein [Methyloligella halotolerans]|uniref:universal stress protein n=1 Tax=Methyloligella halotolerans TaxID=1177755 RepID=UPI00315B0CF8